LSISNRLNVNILYIKHLHRCARTHGATTRKLGDKGTQKNPKRQLRHPQKKSTAPEDTPNQNLKKIIRKNIPENFVNQKKSRNFAPQNTRETFQSLQRPKRPAPEAA
jgi:hypothetical protein